MGAATEPRKRLNATQMLTSRANLRVALLTVRNHQDPIEGLDGSEGHAGARVEQVPEDGVGPQTVRLVGEPSRPSGWPWAP